MLQTAPDFDSLTSAAGQAARALPSAIDAAHSVSDLPWGADALALTGVLLGLALWLAGKRLIRPLFALGAAGLFGAIGFFGPASLGVSVSPHIGLATGAVAGAIIGVVLYRLAMAAALGVAMALATPILLAVVLGVQAPEARALSQQDMLLEGVPMQGDAPAAMPARDAHAAPVDVNVDAARKVRAFVKEAYLEAESRWVALSLRDRVILLGVAFSGGAVGFLTGLLIPKTVALLATALLGPVLWAPCAIALGRLHNVRLDAIAPSTAQGWLIVWLGLSAVGVVVQWTARSKRADKRE